MVQPDEAQTGRHSIGAAARRDSITAPDGLAAEYLELLKRSLTATVHRDVYLGRSVGGRPSRCPSSWHPRRWLAYVVSWALRRHRWELVERCSHEELGLGRAWPLIGETMVGVARLDDLRRCIERVVERRVPGDLVEAGVWRGGASILMRGVLRALDVRDRRVWVADSFHGLPRPDDRFPADAGDGHHRFSELAVPLDVVQENCRRYGPLDAQVRFVPGWSRDTLPRRRGERSALIRLDGDMYESTRQGLEALNPQLSVGGYVIVDDGSLPPCRAAVDEASQRDRGSDRVDRLDRVLLETGEPVIKSGSTAV